ncbi:hypothetical protein Mal15_31510 [Stieleria maiorica]|uniref:Uncharacterized protein n=1 Tax=Stieleria maiorica TaxID=2795974 RepID=A0A5B9MCN3_9BACT|nr:hypothetical protein [Stieleria maiorica]QEF99091.1 hypothetical protein Mal15_31510 [Stieleria maiorica]
MNATTARRAVAPQRPARTGMIGWMVVLILTLLVGTFAITVTRRATHERNDQLHRQRIMILESAIDALRQSEMDVGERIRLPLGDATRWVVVEAVDGAPIGRQYQATLYRNDRPGVSIRRAVENDL